MSDSVSIETTNTSNRRSLKRLLLNPKYQLSYVFWITLTGVLLVALQTAVFYIYTRENYAILVDLSPMTDDAKQLLYTELKRILIILVAVSTLFISLIAFVGLIFSHRTAGPLYHFQRVFKEITGGNTSARIKLRPNDHFHEVAESFNTMMDTLQKK